MNNSFADAIWKYDPDAVVIVEDILQTYFPEKCAAHGLNIAAHNKPTWATDVGNYKLVGIDTNAGDIYDMSVPIYFPKEVSDKTGPMTIQAETVFEKQKLYIAAVEKFDEYGVPKVYMDGKETAADKKGANCYEYIVPKGTKKITIENGGIGTLYVNVIRIGNLVIPTVNTYNWYDQHYDVHLKQPVVTVHKDGTCSENMYGDSSEWIYDVFVKTYDELAQKYGVSLVWTEIGVNTSVAAYGEDTNYDTAYEIGSNPKNGAVCVEILKMQAECMKKHNISWNAMSTNDLFMPVYALAQGPASRHNVNFELSDYKQWEKTGFWYIKPYIDALKKYQ